LNYYGHSNSIYFCAASPPVANAISDMAEVAYVWTTNDSGYGPLIRYSTPPTLGNTYWAPDAPASSFTNIATGFSSSNIIAEQVINFTMTYYDTNGIIQTSWDSQSSTITSVSNMLPSTVYVRLTILDENAIKLLDLNMATLGNVTNLHARTFETLISIPFSAAP